MRTFSLQNISTNYAVQGLDKTIILTLDLRQASHAVLLPPLLLGSLDLFVPFFERAVLTCSLLAILGVVTLLRFKTNSVLGPNFSGTRALDVVSSHMASFSVLSLCIDCSAVGFSEG